MRIVPSLIIFSLPLSFVEAVTISSENLITNCAEAQLLTQQQSTATPARGRGRVECPAADIVGFPPRERKHNRDGEIVVRAQEGWTVCPDAQARVTPLSDNGGSRGDIIISADRRVASMSIHCRGDGLGRGRVWYEAEISVNVCRSVSDRMRMDALRSCMQALPQR